MNELPNELISNIFQFASTSTLANATLCSRRWYNIAIPHLYHRLEIQDYYEQGAPRLKALTTLLLRNPALADHVRHFSLRDIFCEEWYPSQYSEYSLESSNGDLSEIVSRRETPTPSSADAGGSPERNSDSTREYPVEHLEITSAEHTATSSGENGMVDSEERRTSTSCSHSCSLSCTHSCPYEPRYPNRSGSYIERLEIPAEIPEAVKAEIVISPIEGKWVKPSELDRFYRNHTDVYLAALLPHLPKLETLDIEAPGKPIFTWQMFNRIGRDDKHVPAFKMLKSVVWTGKSREFSEVYFCYGMLNLPSIEALYLGRNRTMYYPYTRRDEHLAQLAYAGTSNITHLEIRGGSFRSEDCQHLLLASAHLKSFILKRDRRHDGRSSRWFDLISEGLLKHKDSLEELCISNEFWMVLDWDDTIYESILLKPLTGFSKLERVEFAPEYIFGSDLLPHAVDEERWSRRFIELMPYRIKFLRLTDCKGADHASALLSALEYTIVRRDAITPCLERVVFETNHTIVKEFMDLFTRVSHRAYGAGIKFEILNASGKDSEGNDLGRCERNWGFDEDIVWAGCSRFSNKRPVCEVIDIASQ